MTTQEWIALTPLLAILTTLLTTVLSVVSTVVVALINKRSSDSAMRAMEATIASKDDRIAALKDQIDQAKIDGPKLVEMAVAVRDVKIEGLESELRMAKLLVDQNLFKRVEQLNVTVEEMGTAIKEAQAALARAEEEKGDLLNQTDVQRQEIRDLKANMEKAVRENEQKKKEVADLKRRAQGLTLSESVLLTGTATDFLDDYRKSLAVLSSKQWEDIAASIDASRLIPAQGVLDQITQSLSGGGLMPHYLNLLGYSREKTPGLDDRSLPIEPPATEPSEDNSTPRSATKSDTPPEDDLMAPANP